MVGRFTIYPIGKSKEAFKSGKYSYTFVNGIKGADPKALIDKCSDTITIWTKDGKLPVEFMKGVQAEMDVSGGDKGMFCLLYKLFDDNGKCIYDRSKDID